MASSDHGKYSTGGGRAVDYDEQATLPEDIETHEEAERQGPSETWTFWEQQIRAAFNGERRFRDEGKEAEKAYFGDDKKPYTDGEYQKEEHKTNIIHANIEVLKPLVYSDTPDPIVRRRFGGDGDNSPTERIAALVVQRLAEYLIDTTRFDEAMEQSRDDWLVPGRGACRVMYRTQFASVPVTDDVGLPVLNDDGSPKVVEKKVKERIKVRHWPWSRVLFSPANSWDECRWIAFETPMTKKQVADRFDKPDAAHKCSELMQYPIDGLKGDRKDDNQERTGWENDDEDVTSHTKSASAHDQCIVHEIWDKESRRVIWWSPDYKEDILDEADDPLGLEEFFDCPKPLLSVTKNGMLTPRPDVAYYRARADEVDIATQKLRTILTSISLSGVYPGKMVAEIEKLLTGSNKLVAIEDWMAFMEKGGSREMIQWLPLEQFVSAAQALVLMREQAKQSLYEISGVSDIVRGQSDPNETLGAQQIKGNYANLRLRDKQNKQHKFARDTIRIMVEIAVEHFDTKTIADIVNLQLPETDEKLALMNAAVQAAKIKHSAAVQAAQVLKRPPPPEPEIPFYEQTSWEAVHAMLRDDMTRRFSLSIETDGTILQDADEDKKQRIEFLQAFVAMAENLLPMAQSGIVEMKVIKELLMFAVRGFPKSRTLEGMLSSLPDSLDTKPKEDPSVTIAKIRAESAKMIKQMELTADQKEGDAERQHEMRLAGAKVIADGFMEQMKGA